MAALRAGPSAARTPATAASLTYIASWVTGMAMDVIPSSLSAWASARPMPTPSEPCREPARGSCRPLGGVPARGCVRTPRVQGVDDAQKGDEHREVEHQGDHVRAGHREGRRRRLSEVEEVVLVFRMTTKVLGEMQTWATGPLDKGRFGEPEDRLLSSRQLTILFPAWCLGRYL